MASESDALRKMASELRDIAKRDEQARMAKTAQLLQAATALEILRRKVKPNDV